MINIKGETSQKRVLVGIKVENEKNIYFIKNHMTTFNIIIILVTINKRSYHVF